MAYFSFSVVAQDPVQCLEEEVLSVSVFLDPVEEPHALDIVVEPADAVAHADLRKVSLSVMAERGVSDIMAQGDGLDQVFVQSQHSSDAPGNSGHKLHMKDAVGDMVVLNE